MIARIGPMLGAALLAAWGSTAARAGELRPIRITGPATNLQVVVVSEGYLASDAETFFADAAHLADGLLDYGPYRDTAALVNVHALFVPSQERGADHPAEGRWVDTAFDARFDTNGIERLISFDTFAVLAAATAALPGMTVAVLLVHDGRYGGSGGAVASVSTNRHAIAILRHELGHTLGGLADEYEVPYPGKPPSDSEPNVALAAHLHPPKWRAWIEPGTPLPTPATAARPDGGPIGAYEGARYHSHGIFRPAPTCLMRSLDHDFCPVCYEAIILGVHRRARVIQAWWPGPEALACTAGACPRLEVETAALEGLRVRWAVGKELRSDAWFFRPERDELGKLEVDVTVERETEAVRADTEHDLRDSRAWRLSVSGPPPPRPDEPAPPAAVGCATAPSRGAGTTLALTVVALLAWGRVRRRGLGSARLTSARAGWGPHARPRGGAGR